MKFKFKVITSFILTISFLIAALSGLAMYLAPKGRIANWIEWTWLGFTKEEWTAVHTTFVAVFLLAALLHLFYFNWRVFWAYIKQKAQRGIRYKWELAVSLALGLVLWFGTTYEVTPVISLVRLAEAIDVSYETRLNEPPIPHAEELTLLEFSEEVLQIPVEEALETLKKKGYSALNHRETVGDLAERHQVPPRVIYGALSSRGEASRKALSYSGYGQKTLAQVCEELEIELSAATRVLNDAGISDADAEETLKAIADRHDRKPIDLVLILTGEEPP